jgi:SAM-dependent methyltransferase
VTGGTATFESTLRAIDGIDGWMTDEQARRLWDRAGALSPPARIVEIGSFHGRSTIVLATAAAEGVDVVAVDPHLGSDRGPNEIAADRDLGERDYRTFHENLAAASVDRRVRHLRAPSCMAVDDVPDDIDLLYVDGAHRFAPALDDLRGWGAKVRDGGRMLVHDSWSSVGVTLALLLAMAPSPRWRYAGRVGSLAEYVRLGEAQALTGSDRASNALAQLRELPWFVRNLAVKLLIVAKLTPLTRLLGHRTGYWPY